MCQPISATMVETVLSHQFDDLEPTLTRHGYHLTDLVQQFDAKPTEIKALFNNQRKVSANPVPPITKTSTFQKNLE